MKNLRNRNISASTCGLLFIIINKTLMKTMQVQIINKLQQQFKKNIINLQYYTTSVIHIHKCLMNKSIIYIRKHSSHDHAQYDYWFFIFINEMKPWQLYFAWKNISFLHVAPLCFKFAMSHMSEFQNSLNIDSPKFLYRYNTCMLSIPIIWEIKRM